MPKAEFPAAVESLESVNAFVEGFLEQKDCPPKATIAVMTALEELFVNVAHYSGSPVAVIELECENGAVTLSISDSGTPFDPFARQDPDTSLPASDRPIGGLGILMVKKMMDQVSYERRDGMNIIRIEKKFA